MYRGDKEEGPEQIPGVHHVLESAVLIYSRWPVQIGLLQQLVTWRVFQEHTD